MACKSCKSKKSNKITSLTENVDYTRLKQAYEYVSIASKMDDSKWDYVEEVLNDYYPSRHPLNRQCGDCLRQASKLIIYLYKKQENK